MRDFKGMKRQRGRNRGTGGPGGGGQTGGGKPTQNVNRAFDSNGPDGVKVRGHAQSVYEKYQQLARDAFSSGDRVLAENHLQHAEHYFRVLRLIQPQRPTAEIVARDVFASGFDIDFEDEGGEGEEASFASDADEAREESREAYTDRPRSDARDQSPQGQRDRNDRDRNDRDRGERREGRFGDRPNGDRPNGDRQNGERQNGDRQNQDRSNGERTNASTTIDRSAPERTNGETDRGNGDRQNGDRQNGDRQNGDRQGRQRDRGDRGDRPRYEGPRRDERAPGYGEQPREFGRERVEPRAEGSVVETPVETARPVDRLEPRADQYHPETAQVVEPQPRPTPLGTAAPVAAPISAAAEQAPVAANEGARVLRSVDGGVSEAPAFLQAFAAPVASAPLGEDEEPVAKRPRGRPRKRPLDVEAEDNAPSPAAEPQEV